jgi:tRNA modification GTPase
VRGQWQSEQPQARIPCLLYYWPNASSYTRQPVAEIHTVGSPPLLECLLRQACSDGARLARPGEFTLRAFLAGRLDLAQAEAVLGVIDAHDQRQLRVALTQLAGGLSHVLHQVRERLLNLCADIEAALDFADEDLQFVSSDEACSTIDQIRGELDQLLSRLSTRAHANKLPRLALRGRPNVGKSTLWNALIGRDAAIVSAVPGTTRDYLEASMSFGGQPCRLIDSAGIDAQLAGPIDRAAQELATRVRDDADLVLLCLDVTRPLDNWERAELDHGGPDLVLLCKCDLVEPSSLSGWLRPIPPLPAVPTSGATGLGLDQVATAIANCLQQRSSEESSLVAATATRCRESVRLARAALVRAIELVRGQLGQELVAAELREALDQLGLILGTVYTDDILDRVFGRFCIGK